MMLQAGTQTKSINILPNMAIRPWKLVSLKNITWEIFFFTNHPENKAGKLASDLFLFFKKVLFECKTRSLVP